MDSERGPAVAAMDGKKRTEQGAPGPLDGASDATWSAGVDGMDDVYAFALTVNGGQVYAELKKINLALEWSAASEAIGQLKLSDKALYARVLCEANGFVLSGPTVLAGDCMPALRAANGQSSVVRLKHSVRRYAIIQQRVQSRDVRLAHVPDEWNWTDFMTKWVDKGKYGMSVRYLSNEMSRQLYFAKEPADDGEGSWA